MQVFYTYVNNFVDRKNKNLTSMLRSRTVACWKRHKRLVTPLFWNGFSALTSLLSVIDRKEIAFLESVDYSACVYMKIFNFRDGHVTTFRHPSGAYICQMPGHRLSRLAKGTPSESRLSIGTIGLG